MFNVVIACVVSVYVFLLVMGIGAVFAELIAERFRHDPYNPHPGHQRAAEREARWYPQ